MKRVITTPEAAAPAGAYSQGTTDGDLVFTAGQIAKTPEGDSLVDEPIEVQTRQCIENIKAILEEEGVTLQDVLKTTVYLDDIGDFEAVNETYSEYFRDNPPARSAFEVANLPGGAGIEIEAVAAKK
ncbi:MAG: Rid family detoxifying hydrolase [Halobacteriales archaeon]|nr:Rid family detoxifying hydrolase [Halobacteriales archaeon]